MNSNWSSLRPSVSTSRQVVGSCLLLFHLLAGTPLFGALTTLVAMADRSHQLTVQTATGALTLVLRHASANLGPHRHGMAARALAWLAERPVPGRPDHRIGFAGRAAPEATTASSDVSQLRESVRETVSPRPWSQWASRANESPALAPSPPLEGTTLNLRLRTVVLLL